MHLCELPFRTLPSTPTSASTLKQLTMVEFDPSFEIMPGTKAKKAEVVGYMASGVSGKPDRAKRSRNNRARVCAHGWAKLACRIGPSLIALRLSLLPACQSRGQVCVHPSCSTAAAWVLRSESETTCSVKAPPCERLTSLY